MQGLRAAGKKRGPMAAPQGLQPRAGSPQPRGPGPHPSERAARKHEWAQDRQASEPEPTKDATATGYRVDLSRPWEGLTDRWAGLRRGVMTAWGWGANCGLCGQGSQPPSIFF